MFEFVAVGEVNLFPLLPEIQQLMDRTEISALSPKESQGHFLSIYTVYDGGEKSKKSEKY